MKNCTSNNAKHRNQRIAWMFSMYRSMWMLLWIMAIVQLTDIPGELVHVLYMQNFQRFQYDWVMVPVLK